MSLSKKTNAKYQKMKTLCTLDSNDIFLSQDIYRTLMPKKKLSKSKNKKLSFLNHSPQKKLENLTFENFYQRKTPNSKSRKIRTSTNKSRMKTQSFDIPKQNTPKKQHSCCKKIKFCCDQKYNFQTYQIVKKLIETKDQKIYLVRYLHSFLNKDQYLMKKSKNKKKGKQFERQLKIKQQLTSKMKGSQKKYFQTVYKHYYQKKNLVLVFNSSGEGLNWHNEIHQRFIKNLKKNNFHILKHLIKQIIIAIQILSFYGYAHTSIQIKNILLEIEDNRQMLKVNKSLKLAKVSNCIKMSQKKEFLQMSNNLFTPPQIINYKLFESQDLNQKNNYFDRELIQSVQNQNQGWKIDVWSLGILILELINEKPLLSQHLSLGQILQFQKNINLTCQCILQKIQDQALNNLVCKMLSKNPEKRPNPQQILSILQNK